METKICGRERFLSWIIISKDITSNKFYPIDVLSMTLPNSTRLSYQSAKNKPLSFWRDKKVIFHMTWAGKYLKVWETFYRKIIRSKPRQFWIEFDADRHMNRLQNIDKSFQRHMCMYYRIYKYCQKFLWELPMAFNPFMEEPTRVPVGLYQRSRELPIKRNKDIDFLGFIDQSGYNTANTFRLLTKLSEKYKVACITVSPDVYKYYSTEKWGFELIKNSKTKPGQQKFYSFLDRSKVLVDLSYRITLGRNLYEALFHSTLCVCPTTYGASEMLFPDLVVDPVLVDLVNINQTCLAALEKWKQGEVQKYRDRSIEVASIQKTITRLQRASK